jgi:hypothetical protein
MIVFKQKGDFSKITKYLEKTKKGINIRSLEKYGQAGVAALASNTPTETGLTANSWYYEISRDSRGYVISFNNSNVVNGWCNIAIILQYGHATGNGGWVEGRDYINPAIQPVFDNLANDAWEEVTKL